MRSGQSLRPMLVPVAIVAASLLLIAGLIIAAGYDAPRALDAALRGTVGSPFAVFSATLKRSTPLILLGLAVSVAFRAGVLNIGGDGQFLAGAAAGVALALGLPAGLPAFVVLPLELVAGVAAGAAWAMVPAWLQRRFSVSEVVSTLLMNFVAINIVGFLIRGPMQEPTGAYPQSATLPARAWLPLLGVQQLHLGFVLALVLVVGIRAFFAKTAAGFRFRVTGANPAAAVTAGRVNVARVRMEALILSGAIAGLAGIGEASGVTHALYEGLSPGYGYAAIGVALLGGLNPIGIVFAAIVFGALGAAADAMQRDASVPPELASVVAALIILGMLAAAQLRHRNPTAPPAPAP